MEKPNLKFQTRNFQCSFSNGLVPKKKFRRSLKWAKFFKWNPKLILRARRGSAVSRKRQQGATERHLAPTIAKTQSTAVVATSTTVIARYTATGITPPSTCAQVRVTFSSLVQAKGNQGGYGKKKMNSLWKFVSSRSRFFIEIVCWITLLLVAYSRNVSQLKKPNTFRVCIKHCSCFCYSTSPPPPDHLCIRSILN